ncbi:hypothetical protein O181_116893, partial [Austropuccinia psidii MF-1]|nr:hypothetical protein [Austropuccinia psidii MF-1]
WSIGIILTVSFSTQLLSQRQSQKICIEFLSIEVLWPSRGTYHQSLIFEQDYYENLKSTLDSP